jgi:ribosome biogenesis GTPase
MKLAELGWLQYSRKEKSAEKIQADNVGRIGVENKTNFLIHANSGELAGIIQGKFRHSAKSPSDFPKVGDWVEFKKLQGEDKAVIEKVLPRYSVIARKGAGDSKDAQIIAANVDFLFIVYGLDKEFNAPLIERYISMAYEGGVEPIILLNKTDKSKVSAKVAIEAEKLAAGLEVHTLSAINSEGLGKIEALIEPGRTFAFVGPSGVGKSTIINALIGSNVQTTGEVRLVDSKGRHTTTRREIFVLPNGGILIDTPGIRELETLSTGETVKTLFADIEQLASKCRFRNCDHINSKSCAVLAAVKEGKITKERYDNFIKLNDRANESSGSNYGRQKQKIKDKQASKAASEASKKRLPGQANRRK